MRGFFGNRTLKWLHLHTIYQPRFQKFLRIRTLKWFKLCTNSPPSFCRNFWASLAHMVGNVLIIRAL